MASEIIGTQAVLPVTTQQRFDSGRAANQPDQGLAKAGVDQMDLTQKAEDKELAPAISGKEVDESKSKQEEQLADKILQLNDYAQNIDRKIQFSVHKETDRTVVIVIDPETDKVIRQIPSEEILKIAESMENFSGMLLKEQA